MSVKVVDVNALLYAVNQDADRHTMVRRWWEKALNGVESVGLPWIVLSGFLRISTNPKAYPEPMSTDRALARVSAWLSANVVPVVVEKPDHWRVFGGLLADTGAAGNLTTDAHLAPRLRSRMMQRSFRATAVTGAGATEGRYHPSGWEEARHGTEASPDFRLVYSMDGTMTPSHKAAHFVERFGHHANHRGMVMRGDRRVQALSCLWTVILHMADLPDMGAYIVLSGRFA